MRRLLLAGVISLGLSPAHAQVVTIDPAEITQTINTLHQLQQAYQVAQATFGALLRVVNPNGLATGMIGSNPIPGMSQVGGMMTGSGNFGSLSGLASQFQRSNTVYQPRSFGSSDYNALYLQRNGNSLAGIQAMSANSMNSIQDHIAGLTQIQGQLSTVQSQADLTAINGRLQAEQANLQAQQVQAQALNTMMQAQQQQYQLQGEQLQRKSADDLMAAVNGNSTSTVSVSTFNQADTNAKYKDTLNSIWQYQANQAETAGIGQATQINGPMPSMSEMYGTNPLIPGVGGGN